MRKSVYYILILAFTFISQGLAAQEEVQDPVFLYHNKIQVVPISLQQQGKDLYIRLLIKSERALFRDCEAATLIPVLISPQGRRLELPNVQINGRSEDKAYRRAKTLAGGSDYTHEITSVQAGKLVDYRQKIRYKPWMQYARLDFVAQTSGCGSEWADVDSGNLKDSLSLQREIQPYKIDFRCSYLLPDKNTELESPLIADAYLEFPVNRTEILYNFRNNAAELEKVRYMVATAISYSDITIKGIYITGYASPEGPVENNNRLAGGRAEALRNYLVKRGGGVNPNLYIVSGGGEDWKGLETLVENSPFRNNLQLKAILVEPENRKERLMGLDDGAAYSQLLTNLYPQLRRVTCRIDYEIKEDEMNERIGDFTAQAAPLNLNQIYQTALRFPRESEAFWDVLESAAKAYSTNPLANLNAASAALVRGDLSAADRFIRRAGTSLPEYYNVCGVLEMLRGNYKAAEKLLQRALEAGVPEAGHNLEELQKKLENIEAIKTYRKNNR